jgi:predicted ATPase/DNA-binding winged helix-turn-helix (wHTH) protein
MSDAADPLPRRLQFGPFELDLAGRRLRRAGQPVALPPRYFDVLAHLAAHGGRLVSKDELLDAVWGHRHVSDSVLKVAVNALRQALGEDPKAPRHLQTVPRRGYRFEGVTAADVPAPGPHAAVPVAAGNLPAGQPALVGREADALRLRAALQAWRLVTLHGPAGVGKTRLALAEAGHAPPRDGVWLLRLDHLADGGPLLATLAHMLGLPAGADASPAALARALAASQLRLVLDNAEHLVGAVAELAATLLAQAPGVSLLVTSQVPLRLAEEQLLPLPPLALDGATQLLRDAVRRQPGSPADDQAALADAQAIAQALDGLPLALELAAARVPLLGWAGVRQRLGERLGLLTRGDRGAPERHRTLRAALAWSCSLLQPAEQALLQRLSVFAGSFSVEAAIAVGGADADLLDHLDALREHALIVPAPATAAAPRWRLYDSVRSFAAEGLRDSGHELAAQQALVQHMLGVFQQAEARYLQLPLLPWLDGLHPEADNLRAALRLGLAHAALQPLGVALFAASAQYRARGGWRREALQDHARLAALPREGWPAALQAELDFAQAQLAALAQGLPPQEGLQALQRARDAWDRAGGPDIVRRHAAQNAECALLLRQQAPLPQRASAVARLRALEGPEWNPLQRRYGVWQQLLLMRDSGDDTAYEERAAAVLATSRALGDDNTAWATSQLLSQLKATQGRTDTAIELLDRTVAEMRTRGQLRQNAPVLAQQALLHATRDGSAATVALLREAVLALQAEGMLWWMADALAWLPAQQGRWADAARVQAWADGLVRQRGDKRGPMFNALRQRWQQRLQQQATAVQALLEQPGEPLDETAALGLVFG